MWWNTTIFLFSNFEDVGLKLLYSQKIILDHQIHHKIVADVKCLAKKICNEVQYCSFYHLPYYYSL